MSAYFSSFPLITVIAILHTVSAIANSSLASPAASSTPISSGSARVLVTVDNVRSSAGVIGVLVFKSPEGWPEQVGRSFAKASVPANRGVTSVAFDDLQPGAYAFVVLHDENENMKLDRNIFGRPREGWGMSNDPEAFGRAPSFNSARVVVGDQLLLRVHLNY